jgi:hypothetical protein
MSRNDVLKSLLVSEQQTTSKRYSQGVNISQNFLLQIVLGLRRCSQVHVDWALRGIGHS